MKLSKILLMSTVILIGSGALLANVVAVHAPADVEFVLVSHDAMEIATVDFTPIVPVYCGDPDWNQVPKHEEGRLLFKRPPVGDPYLVRSQSWIRNNNLAANGRLHIFILEFSHARSIA